MHRHRGGGECQRRQPTPVHRATGPDPTAGRSGALGGIPIFERRSSGVTPTVRGSQFLADAHAVVHAYEALVGREQADTVAGAQRPLRLGLLDEGFGGQTTAVLRAFADVQPNCEVVAVPLRRPDSRHPLSAPENDVDVVVGDDPPPDEDDIRSVIAYHADRMAAVPLRSDLSDSRQLHVSDLFGRTWARTDHLAPATRSIFTLEVERGEAARFSTTASRRSGRC